MILILDGEELVGAKQNRIVNTTILVVALSTLVIPVSCVEQGRWSYRERGRIHPSFPAHRGPGGRGLPDQRPGGRAGQLRQPDTLARVFRKLVQSYALEAIDFLEPDKEIKVSRTGASDLIQSARPACGIKDRRYIDEVLREFIHKIFSNRKNFIWMARWSTCRFLTGLKMRGGPRFSRMGSFSNRRRNRG